MGVLVWRSIFTNLCKDNEIITRSPCPWQVGPQTGTLWYRSPWANIDEASFRLQVAFPLIFSTHQFDGYTFFGWKCSFFDALRGMYGSGCVFCL